MWLIGRKRPKVRKVEVINRLNLVLEGWGRYFRCGKFARTV
ncbi:MAG: hypothetical protein J6N18_00130 [Kiritimatiellae bacterium]|nr:hypothetical protein [Kiritimatiellia bacterium]MBR3821404.1 hypothetical protein [Kiritimatiellia bacterium]